VEHRYALSVGTDYYNDTTHFIPLPFAQSDAHILYNMLIDPERRSLFPESTDGHLFAAASEDGRFKLWNVLQRQKLQNRNHHMEVFGMHGLPTNNPKGGAIRIWQTYVTEEQHSQHSDQ
jgi:hypothetical protein